MLRSFSIKSIHSLIFSTHNMLQGLIAWKASRLPILNTISKRLSLLNKNHLTELVFDRCAYQVIFPAVPVSNQSRPAIRVGRLKSSARAAARWSVAI